MAGKWSRLKTQKLLITPGLVVKGERGVEDAECGARGILQT